MLDALGYHVPFEKLLAEFVKTINTREKKIRQIWLVKIGSRENTSTED